MFNVTIKIYEEYEVKGVKEEKVISVKYLKRDSVKKLTGKGAGQILANEFPEFDYARKGMIKTEKGWHTFHSTKPQHNCSYHYIWRHALIIETIEQM